MVKTTMQFGGMMKSVNLDLKTAEQVKLFVAIAEKYEFEIDVRSGRHVVDAKSMLGIFSLDLNQPLVVEIYSDECDAFLKDIEDYTL